MRKTLQIILLASATVGLGGCETLNPFKPLELTYTVKGHSSGVKDSAENNAKNLLNPGPNPNYYFEISAESGTQIKKFGKNGEVAVAAPLEDFQSSESSCTRIFGMPVFCLESVQTYVPKSFFEYLKK